MRFSLKLPGGILLLCTSGWLSFPLLFCFFVIKWNARIRLSANVVKCLAFSFTWNNLADPNPFSHFDLAISVFSRKGPQTKAPPPIWTSRAVKSKAGKTKGCHFCPIFFLISLLFFCYIICLGGSIFKKGIITFSYCNFDEDPSFCFSISSNGISTSCSLFCYYIRIVFETCGMPVAPSGVEDSSSSGAEKPHSGVDKASGSG